MVTKIDDTKFSEPQQDKEVDVSFVILMRKRALRHLEIIQAEIAGYDETIAKAKSVGIVVEALPTVDIKIQ